MLQILICSATLPHPILHHLRRRKGNKILKISPNWWTSAIFGTVRVKKQHETLLLLQPMPPKSISWESSNQINQSPQRVPTIPSSKIVRKILAVNSRHNSSSSNCCNRVLKTIIGIGHNRHQKKILPNHCHLKMITVTAPKNNMKAELRKECPR